MASTKSLDDIFDSVADESAVRALVGSLESQLASPTIHVPSQDLSSASVTNNHVNSAPVGDGTLTRLHDGTKHGVANLGQGNTVILNSDTSKSLTTTSQLLGVNSIVSSSAQPTNTITVTLAGAVPASGYINQVTSVTTQQALINSAASLAAGRSGPPEIKIVYPPQSSVSQYTSINVGSAAGDVIQPPRSSGVLNGTATASVSKPGQSHPNNTAAISAIQNLASVAAQQQPLLVPNQHQQGGKPQQLLSRLTVREQLEQKQHDKLVPKPQIVIKPDGVSSVVVNMKTEPSTISTADSMAAVSPVQSQSNINVLKSTASTPTVITVSKSGQLQPQVSQGVNMVTQMVSNPNIIPGVQIVNMNAVRPGAPGTPGQKTLAPRVVLSNPVRIAASQVLGPRPGTPGPPGTVPNTITLQPGNLVRGTLLVKTENGQYQLVNVGTALAPGSNASTIPGTATYRLQTMPQVRPGWHPEESVLDSKIMCGKPQTWQHKFSRSFLENPAGHNPVRSIAPQQVTVTLPVSQPNQQVKLHQQQATGTSPHTMVHSMLHGSQPSVTIVTSAPGTYTQSGASGPTLVHQVPSTGAGTMPTQHLALQTAGMVQPLTSTSQNAAASQMSPDTAKKKCKNFLSTLLRLASDQPEQVATNVKNLIQGLIDGNVQPEDFTNQLQKELNSSPQPCLVPFLKKSLPYLRHSLATRELTIDGVRPPPQNTVVTLPATPTSIPQIQTRPPMPMQQAHVRLMTPGGPGTITAQVHQPGLQGILSQRLLTPTQRMQTPLNQGKSLLGTSPRPIISGAAVLSPAVVGAIQRTHPARAQVTQIQAAAKEKEKRSYSSTLRDDDDINDVAAMGGVNLVEESAQILAANAEFVGTQIRSCKDENFLFTGPLQRRIKAIAAKCGLDEPSSDVVALISHATQERLKTIVEKLGVIAEHRLDVIKTDPRYEVTQDVKGQIKFLEELDRLEKKKHEEQEREILLRAAKSRSKVEDPEQIKLKQKAKEMQRAEMEEVRQREANMTALLAIGPRKKLKTETPSSTSSSQASSTGSMSGMGNFGSSTNRPQMMRPRVKRVNLRDLVFLMEQERDMSRSVMLYKSYLK